MIELAIVAPFSRPGECFAVASRKVHTAFLGRGRASAHALMPDLVSRMRTRWNWASAILFAMTMPKIEARVVLTTTSDPEEARRLGRVLVEERLIACATIIPAVVSMYRWQGKLESGSESLLLLKTDAQHIEAVRERLHQVHSYETPEFLVLPVENGSEAYLKWLGESLGTLTR